MGYTSITTHIINLIESSKDLLNKIMYCSSSEMNDKACNYQYSLNEEFSLWFNKVKDLLELNELKVEALKI
jgi:hypothetical protein